MWTTGFVHECHCGHDLARSAVAALIPVTGHKRGLHGMKITRLAEPLDSGDLISLMHYRKRKTRIYPAAVDMDRARAALPVVAPFFGPGQSDVFAEAIEQGGTRIQLELMFGAIDP
jgi:hypothetical protein